MAFEATALRQRKQVAAHLSRSSSTSSLGDDAAGQAFPAFTPPNFTIKELLAAIPPHCFDRSALKSSSYVLMDLTMLSILVFSATYIDPNLGRNGALVDGTLGLVAKVFAWGLYGYAAGLVGTGIWVIAHECGHQGYSPSKTINNTVGWILHSALLVPYHSWRITHGQHHASTGHMTRDQVFVPKTRSQRGLAPLAANAPKNEVEGTMPASAYDKLDDLLEDAPLWAFINIVAQQIFGWPLYLFTNASGQYEYPAGTNHFTPKAVMFDARHWRQVLVSDLGIAITMSALTFFGYKAGFAAVFKFYIVPYLWVNHWLVMITFLQHTDAQLPHYRGAAFNFQRGALCTIDRKIHGFFFHGIAETHVAHHLSSKIPHYNAWEATAALKDKLGSYYMQTDENPWVSLWKSYTQCRFVEDEGDVVFYKDAKGRARRKVARDSAGSVSDSGVDVMES